MKKATKGGFNLWEQQGSNSKKLHLALRPSRLRNRDALNQIFHGQLILQYFFGFSTF